MQQRTVRSIAAAVAGRKISAEAVAADTIERAERYAVMQPEAWISRFTAAELIERAQRIDARIERGERLALAGVPVAVKDNIDVTGLDTTAACPAFAYRPAESAAVIDALTQAGALIVGKTNLDQFATGLSGTRSPHGSLGCVFNRDYVSGGSSSGSAVVTGAGVVPLALGTDTAGSGRVPAAFNHLIGFKPTRGRWSTRGLLPACRSLDCITSFTVDAEDAALVDSVLARFDPLDPYSRTSPDLPTTQTIPAQDLRGVRAGIPGQNQIKDLTADDARLYWSAIDLLRGAGATLVEVDIAPLLDCAALLYNGPWVAERTAALETLLDTNPSAIHPVVRAIVQSGRGLSAIDAFRGQYALMGHVRRAAVLWETIDMLILPTTPGIFRRSELMAAPVELNSRLGLYTNFVNLLDMSAVAVPAGFRANGTGAGITLIGPAWSDSRLLHWAGCYERAATPWAVPPLDLTGRVTGIALAVVGAHLSGLPLHWQLSSRGARLVRTTRTAPAYRLYAMGERFPPPRPALIHVGSGGAAIEVEVYELEAAAFGSFTAEISAPLAIGAVQLEGGETVRGFVAEPRSIDGALDITALGGWRAYLAQLALTKGATP
jgi:allophanate hydrolase